MDLAEFVDTYRDAIAQRVVASYPPRYRPFGERALTTRPAGAPQWRSAARL